MECLEEWIARGKGCRMCGVEFERVVEIPTTWASPSDIPAFRVGPAFPPMDRESSGLKFKNWMYDEETWAVDDPEYKNKG